MAFTLPLTCTSAASLICPDLPEGPVSNIPLKKARVELLVWHKGHDYSNNAPLGMAVVTYRLIPACLQ
jgi:hypothetical protein